MPSKFSSQGSIDDARTLAENLGIAFREFQLAGDSERVALTCAATFLLSPPWDTLMMNSGTFIKRKGKWQVVNWQSTKVPFIEGKTERPDREE